RRVVFRCTRPWRRPPDGPPARSNASATGAEHVGTPVGTGAGGAGPRTRRADGTPVKGPVKARRAGLLGMRGRRALVPWALLAPALVVVGALLLFPLGRIVWLSFRDYRLRNLDSVESDFIVFHHHVAL